MQKIIQITDPHLSRPGQVLWGQDPYERLQAAFKDILTFHSDAKACFISGDLTDSVIRGIALVKRRIGGVSNFNLFMIKPRRQVSFLMFETYPEMKMGFYNIHSN